MDQCIPRVSLSHIAMAELWEFSDEPPMNDSPGRPVILGWLGFDQFSGVFEHPHSLWFYHIIS